MILPWLPDCHIGDQSNSNIGSNPPLQLTKGKQNKMTIAMIQPDFPYASYALFKMISLIENKCNFITYTFELIVVMLMIDKP